MDEDIGVVVLIALLIIGIPIVRYFVWASRYRRINLSLDMLKAGQADLNSRVDNMEEMISARDFLGPPTAHAPPIRRAPSRGPVVAKVEALAHLKRPAPALEAEPVSEAPKPAISEELAEQLQASASWTERPEAEAVKPGEAEVPISESKGPKPPMIEPVAAAGSALRRVGDSIHEKLRGTATDWETLIGGRWLNLIGIIVLVIGIVLLTQYAMEYMSALQKIVAGAVFGAALIAGGMLMERLMAYRRIGRTLMGGGWALLYFDAFAAHQLPQAKIIEDPVIGLAALAGVAAGMIGHSLRYRSQLVTGLAYGLGFMAIVLTEPTLMSLAASALLAASLVIVTRVMSWHELAIAGVLGTYLNHWNWLRVVNKARAAAADASVQLSGMTAEQAFWLSSAILVFYWILFAAVSLNRSIVRERDSNIHVGINIANTVGMLSLMMLQINQHYAGDFLFSLTGPAAVAYAAVSYLDRRFGQRVLFRLNATVAFGLYCATLPLAAAQYGWNDGWLAPYLMGGALLAIAAGFRLQERLLRGEAYLVSLVTLGTALFINLRQPGAEQITALWFAVPTLIVVFQLLSEWLQKRQDGKLEQQEKSAVALAYGIGATLMLASLTWNQVPKDVAGLSWLAIAFVLFESGVSWGRPFHRLQSYLLLAFAFVALPAVNFDYAQIALTDVTAPRWMIVIAAIALYYYLSWRMLSATWRRMEIEQKLGSLPSFAATLLVILLAYHERDHGELAAIWTLWGIILIEAGLFIHEKLVRWQGYGLAALAFASAVAINIYGLDPSAPDTGVANWLMAAVSVLGLAYVFARFTFATSPIFITERKVGDLASAAATLLMALILWHELPSLGVALAWSFLGLVLFELSAYLKTPVLRAEAHLLMIAAFIRLFMANFVIDGDISGLSYRLITAVPVILTVYYLRQRVIEMLAAAPETNAGSLILRQEARFESTLYSYAGAILVVVLFRFEFGRAHAVAAWAPLVLIFLLLGQKLDDRDFRFQSYLLAIYGFFRAWSTNMYLDGHWLGLPERISTTLPMVIALLVAAMLCLHQVRGEVSKPLRGIVAKLDYLDSRARTLYSLLAAGFLAVLFFYHFDKYGFVAAGWAIEGLAFVALGLWLHCRDFKYEGYALALAAFALAMLLGVKEAERLVTTVPVVAVLFAIAFTCPRHLLSAKGVQPDKFHLVENNSRMVFSLTASLLLAVLLYFHLSIDFVSMGWAIQGFALLALGFALNDRNFRIHGLVLLLVCLLKVTFIDLAGVETIYRILSFIVLGLILLSASFAYTWYRDVIGRYI